ncbi:MAG: GPW/gp25 family protein [Lewinellaceae bacterium]|nr:GPW/gp25 family protein [Phaeodactylibacter sp.]MCB9037317.1 GPW/gp25 family protein [Lewinellaceae bacterium]
MDTTNAPFLGSGWQFPPEFSPGGADVAMASGIEDIVQSLEILLGTHLGERIMAEDYGSSLDEYLFEEIRPSVINEIREMITEAVLYYEARIELNQVDIDQSRAGEGLLQIRLDFTVVASNSRFNMVYPFYINEAST